VALIDWLARAVRLGRGNDAASASPFSASKAEAIRSYADFCQNGTPPAYPLEIFLEISNICDLKCAMCAQFSALNVHRLEHIQSRARGFMDQGEISENLEKALSHALLVHCFGYGEPTIHPTFRSFLDLISRYEVLIDFFTNGMHLDEEFCDFLVDRRVYKITVSFSGATKETYESIYLGGDFEKVLGGIRRLADAKKARGSRYPIIEINSLAFRDHVDRFDDFATLMADHGANVVLLKPLQSYETIPELFEHVSIMRPWVEGKIVDRAVRIGRLRGLRVDAALYTQRQAADEGEYDRQMAAMKAEAERALADTGRTFGDNPVSRFGAIADGLEPIRNPGSERRIQQVLSLDSPEAIARSVLDVRPVADGASSFHCMEPFKTLYISRNGGTKSCCFASADGWHLGDAKAEDALSIWRGAGFETTRSAIAEGEYPMKNCKACIRQKFGPQGHFAQHLLESYFVWHRRHFGEGLPRSLIAQMPDLMPLIASTPEVIMARARQGTAAATGALDHAWPQESKAEKAEEFIASRTSYLHRDFVSHGVQPLGRSQEGSADLSPDVLQLLDTCGKRLYSGKGSIVDLGMPSTALQSVIAGLAGNERIASILAAFDAGRDKVVEKFDLTARDNDVLGSDKFMKARIGDMTNVRWLATKPIEICLVQAGAKPGVVQRAFLRLAPSFIPAQTIVILNGFYRQTDVQWKVRMGLLAESFEWAGQAGHAAVLRYLKPLRPEAAAVSPFNLPAELGLRFHRRWHHEGLPRDVQIRLALSYGLLLSRALGPQPALAHLDTLEEDYRDLLGPDARRRHRYGKLLARFREKCASSKMEQGILNNAAALP
jgi:uncharacterized Fe-S cluster-containing radical SAM superfamily protein